METGDKKKAEAKGNQSKRPDLRVRRRQSRVASEEKATCYNGQNPSSVLIYLYIYLFDLHRPLGVST